MGADVTVSSDGNEALREALGQEFDLILMDIQMPRMNGYEATEAIRKAGITTPIIAVTAYAMKGDEEKCLEAGCDGYLAKPIDQTELVQILNKYLPVKSV
jgi:CheY-like chemotaxis protein